MEVAPGVHRCGDWFVNWYLVEDEGEVTVVDAGQRSHFALLEGALRSIGREIGDVKALLLTHADVDHIGFAEELRSKHGVRVHVHEEEAPYAAGKSKQREGGLWRYTRHSAGLRLMAHFARPGGLDSVPVAETSKFRDGERLRVPGGPRAIHTPGHSPGLCAFHLEERKVLIAGDAIVTRNPLTGRVGPQIQPSAFNTSTEEALASLTRLEGLDANRLLPGHGEPWSGSMRAAVARALAAGRS